MSKNTKIILGIVGGVIVLCMCICVGGGLALKLGGTSLAEKMAIDKPEEAAAMAHEMLDYTLPSGYEEKMAIDFWMVKMVMITNGSSVKNDPDQTWIMIAEFPSNVQVTEEELRSQLQNQMNQTAGQRDWTMELTGQTTATIRGQEVNLMSYKGVDEKGMAVKQVVSDLFDGKNGRIMLWVFGTEAAWDQASIDTFFNSIR